MIRREFCNICKDEEYVGDDDPNCCICKDAMHEECKYDSKLNYKTIRKWLKDNDEYDDDYHYQNFENTEWLHILVALEVQGTIMTYDELQQIFDFNEESKDNPQLLDQIPDICPRCYHRVTKEEDKENDIVKLQERIKDLELRLEKIESISKRIYS